MEFMAGRIQVTKVRQRTTNLEKAFYKHSIGLKRLLPHFCTEN